MAFSTMALFLWPRKELSNLQMNLCPSNQLDSKEVTLSLIP